MCSLKLFLSVPQAPPSSLEVAVGRKEGELRVNWSPIGSCADYGGPITGYVIQYKTANEVTFTEQEVGVVVTMPLVLTGLQLSTTYQVKVAARTSMGVGPFTVIMETRTADSSNLIISLSSHLIKSSIQLPKIKQLITPLVIIS